MMHAEFSHSITVDLPAHEAFPLFTPKGEEEWVPGWQPTYIAPETGETCRDMIFVTGSGDDATLWTCLEWQPEMLHVRYLRATPESRVAFVDVSCRAVGSRTTAVRVSYALTALSEAGREQINAMTPQSFAASIDEWAVLIRDHIARKGAA